MKTVALGLLIAFLSGCSSSIVIRNARTNNPTQIEPMAKRLQDDSKDVLIFFVHGVSDHCPGYALDEKSGWLNRDTQTLLHLTAADDGTMKAAKLRDPSQLGDPDPASTYTAAGRMFTYPSADGSKKTVTAVEITWSGLTRWVKTKQLGFDLTEAIPLSPPPSDPKSTDQRIESCEEGAPGAFDQSRVYVNRILKEQVLDRSLADAVLYVGSYGAKINLAMADGICRGLTNNFDKDTLCKWDDAVTAANADRAVFFVTHSLGSRIVYDTLLEMAIPDHPTRKDDPAFGDVPAATQRTSVATSILQHNTATFMMANQLPLLGLTFVPPGYKSTDEDTAYLARVDPGNRALAEFGPGPTHVPLTADAKSATSQLQCGPNPVACAALFRYQHTAGNQKREGANKDHDRLNVVAFSDANDLLTYAIPKAYTDDDDDIRFKFINAYVHNSPRWIGLFENPADAHTNYFMNPTVRQVIVCGGDDKKVLSCRSK